MNIILFGPPGAGKGTQANNLVKTFNLYKISTGDFIRDEIKNNSTLGIEMKEMIDKGLLVKDSIINKLISNTLSNKNFYNRLIFDGYPRNIDQAKKLDFLIKKHNQKISCVLNLNVDKDLIIKRIIGRQTCNKCGLIFNEYFKPPSSSNHPCGSEFLTKRSDDNEKTIASRFETYLKKTLPILDYYKKLNLLHEINGKDEINQIFREIKAILASLEG